MRLWISAGHQENTGAVGYINEGKEAIYLRDTISAIIRKNAPEVELMNDDDRDTLQTVINKMRKFNPDIMLDLHFNAATPKATGTETFISSEKSRDLATILAEVTSSAIEIKSRGIKAENASQHNRLGMLHGFDGIGVLLEVCFVTNKTDTEHYLAHRDLLALRLAECLVGKKNLLPLKESCNLK